MPSPTSIAGVLALIVAISTFVTASEPKVRVRVIEQEEQRVEVDSRVNFQPKLEFGFDKSVSCKGGNDIKKGGAGKKCEGKMKKSVSIGVSTDELVAGMSSDMKDMFQDLMPSKDGFLPVEDDMMALMDMDSLDIDEIEDGYAKTIKIGGFFKLDWDCTVTFKKDGPLKLS
ncbi:hypothetical protein IV203_004005 [Nitzschia inconspicua]|uniref:Uncharacterized protein n=1 Tax=Nitzschia inconspicua TaxID=303405 RepID=A0A9K3L2X7_9STRA|nr:hypothetical protein IV203_004005 [Nitzschia inconspicua]